MKIYVDLVLFLNFIFDFLLLVVVSILLRRNVPIYKLMIGAFLGSLTTLTLFFSISSFTLFLIKLLISILMIIVSFGFQNIRYFLKNIGFLYMSSILLGGFLYFLNIQFSYKQIGLVFYHNGLSINFIVLLISSPIIFYIYIKQTKSLKENYNFYYKVAFHFPNQKVFCNAFLDTGNKLNDPYTNKSIILVMKEKLKDIKIRSPIYVPYNSLNNHGLLTCFKAQKIIIDGKECDKFLVGISEENFFIDGIECILNNRIMEDLR